ncbi:MAG TPA: ATP-dependent zinc metalloprotease FtsH, partial [Polyangiaceae bacterium]|nr:ATP-dependent zinc metalloprotease FtsH [Polyangiaceae bacterium]
MVAAYFLVERASSERQSAVDIGYTAFYELLDEGKLKELVLQGQRLTGQLVQPQQVGGARVDHFRTLVPAFQDGTLIDDIRKKKVPLQVRSEERPFLLELIISLAPVLIIVAVWMWLQRSAQKMMSSGGPFGAVLKGRSRKFERENEVAVSFEDVAGQQSAKRDLSEIVDFLKDPEPYRRLGSRVPKGVLLVGPPGTGKTLLARAVAGEARVPFFSINGSEFVELFVGVGASRVRELFEEAKKVAPAIVFIDEIDAVGRARGAGIGGGHDEREQTLNQLLSEMDGFARNELVIVLAATNRPDVLDPALLRPGRFDRRVVIDRPELAARKGILGVHTKDKPLGADVDLAQLAAMTPGFSGADLANLANEAALHATRRGADVIEQADFRAAFDKIVLGDPRETKLSPEEKDRVAVHEAGHAIVAHFTDGSEPPERVTIIPRGMALGVTQQTPAAERHIMTQPQIEAELQVLMGGHAAERIAFGTVSSGAANDLKRATELAFNMVAHYGMSDAVGPMYHEHRTEHPFLGHTLGTDAGTSDATIYDIEREAKRILSESVEKARAQILQHRAEFDRLVAA